MAIDHAKAKTIHKFAFISDTDPGAVGADKGWVDRSVTPPVLKVRNRNNDGWIIVGFNLDLLESMLESMVQSRFEAIETAIADKQPTLREEVYSTTVALDTGTSGLLEMPVASKICTINAVSVTKNSLLRIYQTEDVSEEQLILEREVVAGVEIFIASPVFAKAVNESIWLLVTNNGPTGAITTTVKFTPFAL